MTSALGNNWQTLNTCVESKESYARLSEKILDDHFEEDRFEKLTELTTFIDNVITDQKAPLDKKFLALSLLKEASKRPSKRFGTAIVKQKSLLQELYKLGMTYTKPESSASGLPDTLEAKYVLLIVESICFWKTKFGIGESNTAEAFRRLEAKLAKAVELPPRLLFYPSEEIPGKLERAGIQEKKNQGKLKLQIPEDIGVKVRVKASEDDSTAGVTDENTRGTCTRGKAKQDADEDDENMRQKHVKRKENFKKLKDELNAYREAKSSKASTFVNYPEDLSDFIWKAKESILGLNIVKISLKCKRLTDECTNMTKAEQKIIQEAKSENEKYLEFENYLQNDAPNDRKKKVIEKVATFFEIKINSPAKKETISESDSDHISSLEDFDKAKPGSSSKQVSARIQINQSAPETRKGSFHDYFQLDKASQQSPGNVSQNPNAQRNQHTGSETHVIRHAQYLSNASSPNQPRMNYMGNRYQGSGTESIASKIKCGGQGSDCESTSSYVQRSFNRTAQTVISYNPEASAQAIQRLVRRDKTVFTDLQKIQNDIVSSLQQRQKPVPWKAFDQLDKIRQEYEAQPQIKHSNSIQPQVNVYHTRTNQKPKTIQSERMKAHNYEESSDVQSPSSGFGLHQAQKFQFNSPSTIHRGSLQYEDSGIESDLANHLGITQNTRQTTSGRKPQLFAFTGSHIRQSDPYQIKKDHQANLMSNDKQANADDNISDENVRSDNQSDQNESKEINLTGNRVQKSHKEMYYKSIDGNQDKQIEKVTSPKSVAFKNVNDHEKPHRSTTHGKSAKSGESRLSKDPKYPPAQGRTTVSPLMPNSKAKGIGGVRTVKDSTWFNELVENLSLSSNPKALEQFCLVACKGKGCVFDNDYLNVNSKYTILEDSDQGYKALKITLLFGNKTNSTFNYFTITFVKHPSINFISLPDKTASSIAPGKQIKVEFIVNISRAPFTHLQIKCGAKLTNSEETQELNFKFVLPVTYNMFMSFQTQITNQDFLVSWKVPTRVILKGEPRILTNPLIKKAEDFSSVLGYLLVFPGVIDESGEPKAYALMGVFELERKNVEYLVKISYIPTTKIVVFEVACTEKNALEGEFILQTLEFLFSEPQDK